MAPAMYLPRLRMLLMGQGQVCVMRIFISYFDLKKSRRVER
jgi:hypothetical protein